MASSSFFWSLQGDAEVVVGAGVFRVEFDGLAVAGDGLVQLPLLLQGDAEVAQYGHTPGPQRQRSCIVANRLLVAWRVR